MEGHVSHHCSFCGKCREMVEQLIAGRDGVCICNECVRLCADIKEDYRNLPLVAPLADAAKASPAGGLFGRLKHTLRNVRTHRC